MDWSSTWSLDDDGDDEDLAAPPNLRCCRVCHAPVLSKRTAAIHRALCVPFNEELFKQSRLPRNVSPPKRFREQEPEFRVAAILDHRQSSKDGGYSFRVQWQDNPQRTWEPMEHFVDSDGCFTKQWKDYVRRKLPALLVDQ